MTNEQTSYKEYVDLRQTAQGDLEIALNESGEREFETIEEVRAKLGINAALETLLEDHLCNGWEMVPPEEIGALTSAPILSDEIERDEEGRIVTAGRVYWFPEYQVCDEIEELREKCVVLFRGVAPVSGNP